MLAQRVADERPQTRGWSKTCIDLLPPDTDRFNFLFDTAVKGSALDAGDAARTAPWRKQQTTLGLREGVAACSGGSVRAPPAGPGDPVVAAHEQAESAAEEAAPGQDMARLGVEKKREAAKSLNGVDAVGREPPTRPDAFYQTGP